MIMVKKKPLLLPPVAETQKRKRTNGRNSREEGNLSCESVKIRRSRLSKAWAATNSSRHVYDNR